MPYRFGCYAGPDSLWHYASCAIAAKGTLQHLPRLPGRFGLLWGALGRSGLVGAACAQDAARGPGGGVNAGVGADVGSGAGMSAGVIDGIASIS